MPAAISITRRDYTAAELRREAKRTDDADAARRMLALALVLEGKSRGEAARSCGMDLQILCDWVHRYNAEGLEGLHNRTNAQAASIKARSWVCSSSSAHKSSAALVTARTASAESRRGIPIAERSLARKWRLGLGHLPFMQGF